MLEKGNQNPLPREDVNARLEKVTGFLEERDAQLWVHDFFKENTSFAMQVLTGGAIELFPFQSMMIKGMMKSDYFLAILSRGGSKCEKWDNLIWTDKGLKRMIDVEIGDVVQSIKGRNIVLDKTINPKDTTYRLQTSHGFVSEGLDYHRVLRLNPITLESEWTFSKDIQVGDYLTCRRGGHFWGKQKDIFADLSREVKSTYNHKIVNPYGVSLEEWYYFFGLLIGDGHIKKRGGSISIETEDLEIIEFLLTFFQGINLDCRVKDNKKSNSKTVECNSISLISLLEWVGFSYKLAHEKTIPLNLLSCDKACAKNLLRGLFDTDGYCSVEKNDVKNSTRVSVGFTSTSTELCAQVRNLLLNFDIISSTRLTSKAGKKGFPNGKQYDCKNAYTVDIGGYTSVALFRQEIDFGLTRKHNSLSRINDYLYSDGQFSEYIPYVGPYLERKYGKKSFSFSEGDSRPTKLTFRKKTSRRWISKCLLESPLTPSDSIKLEGLIQEGVFYSKVISKTESENVTVDIQVDTESHYVSDGIVSHNTWSTAVFLILYALFNQGVHIGVLSASFRQSKMIMKKITDIVEDHRAKFLFKCMTRTSFQNDEWTIEFGRSKITALPLGQGEKLRGFRFQVMVMDELLLMPAKIVNEVIIPFLAVVTNPTERKKVKDAENILIAQGKLTEQERISWPNNKIIGLSSASYQFEHLYSMFKNYREIILGGKNNNAHYSIFRMSFEALPKELYDPALIEKARSEMSEAQVEREFGAIFTSDSSGFFKISKMLTCTFEDGVGQSVEAFGEKDASYVLSIDPSWSESDSSDYFAMHVIKVDEPSETGIAVHPYAIAGGAPKDHIAYFLYLLQNFNIEFIVADFMGGAQFISSCNESEAFKNAKIEIKTIDVEIENPEEYNENIREVRNSYNLTDKRICFLRKPSGGWIRSGNELLQRSFDKKDLMFAGMAMDSAFKRQTSKASLIKDLKFMKEEKGFEPTEVDFVENLKELMTLTRTQCAMIEVSSTPSGHQSFDLPKNLKNQRGTNRARKDLYSALVLGNWGKKIYFDMKKMPANEDCATFVPFVC